MVLLLYLIVITTFIFLLILSDYDDDEVLEEDSGENEDIDGYRTITFLLKHHDWEDLLQDFTDNNLKVFFIDI